MSEEQGGIRKKVGDIANESVARAGDIVEGAKQAFGGDVREGVANIVRAAGDLAAGATEKDVGIAANIVDKGEETDRDQVGRWRSSSPQLLPITGATRAG